MTDVHFRNLDLNLLRVFDGVMEERSVTRAGDRLGLTQSAVSHALNRLRFALGDDLFVRTPEGMTPTARASEIWPRLRRAMGELELAFEPTVFIPAKTDRRFAVAAPGAISTLLLPRVIARIRAEAPGAEVRVRRLDPNVAEQLETGRVDIAIGGFGRVPDGFSREVLLEERMVWAMREDHPAARAPLTLKTLGELPLLMLGSLDVGQAIDGRVLIGGVERRVVWDDGAWDRALAGKAARKRVVVSVDDAQAALAMVAQSDLAALVPLRLAQVWAPIYRLTLLEPPYEAKAVTLDLLWRADVGVQPAMVWLRDLLKAVAKEVW